MRIISKVGLSLRAFFSIESQGLGSFISCTSCRHTHSYMKCFVIAIRRNGGSILNMLYLGQVSTYGVLDRLSWPSAGSLGMVLHDH